VVGGEQIQSLNVRLAVGQVTESVTVTEAAVPLLNAESAVIAGTITARDVENLPSFGRDPLQLARLAPGVFGDGAVANGGGTPLMPGVNRPNGGAVNSIFHRKRPAGDCQRHPSERTTFRSTASA
jgi:hypothetical protein